MPIGSSALLDGFVKVSQHVGDMTAGQLLEVPREVVHEDDHGRCAVGVRDMRGGGQSDQLPTKGDSFLVSETRNASTCDEAQVRHPSRLPRAGRRAQGIKPFRSAVRRRLR